MSKFIHILQERIADSDDISTWLLAKAQLIEKKASNHLKYVANVMPEFDLHDSLHSKAILKIIECILGDSVQSLSSFELFFIIASAYLHDCGMALSDYEKKVLELTEGTEELFIESNSIKNDGKKCYTYAQSKAFIINNKHFIYQDFDGDIKKWLFVPYTENELIDYLSNLLIDYQNFRNGNYLAIKRSSDFSKTNLSLRIEYIRRSHHDRINNYINNWGRTIFSDFPVPGLGQRIAYDLAAICKSHGENPAFLRLLATNIEYYGSDSINLQFIALLLRIGDIVHFSYDRAPQELSSLHQFSSEYSHRQWMIKNNGVNYNIENGTIAFRAFFTNPADYYELSKYIDWIDNELALFQRLKLSWDKKYYIPLKEKVERDNILFDRSVFIPAIGLKFTLNQTKILDLLQGVGLYKNHFACIRELYQNALDACRCQIAKDNALGKKSLGFIEFGIGEEQGEKYLYCLDNGKGMSKEIIEKYLLIIGNSYYKSPDYFQYQAETGFIFTPTSQFGIGILSCFIIGNRIEIITKEDNCDYIACSIDGPREYVYYKKPSKIDEDAILSSGTMVKVFLKKEYRDSINNRAINNLAFFVFDNYGHLMSLRPDLKDDYNNWESSLYNIIDNFVDIVPNQIELYVKWENGNKELIKNKPIVFDSTTLEKVDLNILDKRINMFRKKCEFQLINYINLVDCYDINVCSEGIQFKTILKLPKPGIEQFGDEVIKNIPIKYSYGFCIDGITVNRSNFSLYSFTEILSRHGILNFYGDNRPQLSVDRTEIVESKDYDYDKIAKDIARIAIEKAFFITHNHIEKYSINQGSNLYSIIWKSVFDSFCYSSSIFIESLSSSIYNSINWKNLSSSLDKKLTIGEFNQNDTVSFPKYNYSKFNSVSQNIVLNKFFSATSIIVRGNSVTIKSNGKNNDNVLSINIEDEFERAKFLARTNNYDNTFDDYDIISHLYPIIPDYLFDLVHSSQKKSLNCNFKIITNYSNGISAFYDQNPFEVDEELGLYMENNNMFGNESHVRSLHQKRPSFCFTDIRTPIIEDKSQQQYRLALTAYIAPKELTDNELESLEEYKYKNPSYYKGVTEGWSIITTGESDEKMNTFIKAGKCSRKELVELLPSSFWEKYGDHFHVFPNGSRIKELIGR